MKTKLSAVALVATATTFGLEQNRGGVRAITGASHRGAGARSAPAVHAPMRPGGVSSFRSTPMRSHGSRPFYSGQRNSSFGMRSSPSSAYRRPFCSESRFVHAFRSIHRQQLSGNAIVAPPFENRRNAAVTRRVEPAQHRNMRFRNGNNLRNANNFRNGKNLRNGNNLRHAKQIPK